MESASHELGRAVCRAAVPVKHGWMREWISLHQHGSLQAVTGTHQPAQMSLETRRDACDTEGRLGKRGEKRLQLACEAI